MLPALAVGAGLRLYLLGDQVLLDDEWHALGYVVGSSYGKLLLLSPWLGATGAPLNVYILFLLHTTGWSELGLRLPSVGAGLVSLLVLPILAGRLLGRRVAVVFSLLLAISPFLVFYSRMARPYAMVVLLGTTSTLAFWEWTRTGQRGWRWALVSAITGVLAVWFHPFAAVGVLTPIVWAAGWGLLSARRGRGTRTPETKAARPARRGRSRAARDRNAIGPAPNGLPHRLGRLGLLLAMIVVPAGLLFLPALRPQAGSAGLTSVGQGQFRLAALAGSAELICGTANTPLAAVVLGLALLGVGRWCRAAPVLAGGVVTTVAAYGLVFRLLKPGDIEMFIVMSRYAILLLPLLLLAAACGLEALAGRVRPASAAGGDGWYYGAGTLLCGGLFLAGPLPRTYCPPNNFTNHSAFQESYRRAPADRFYVSQVMPLLHPLRGEDVPVFYHQLARTPEVRMVIEYPMPVGDHLNPLYFYQRIHGKRVKIGYVPSGAGETERAAEEDPGRGRPFVLAGETPDVVLSRVPNRKQLRFRNLTDLTNVEAVRASGADRLILHKDLVSEWSVRRARGGTNPAVLLVAEECRKSFGPPVFEDDQLLVFALKPAGRKAGTPAPEETPTNQTPEMRDGASALHPRARSNAPHPAASGRRTAAPCRRPARNRPSASLASASGNGCVSVCSGTRAAS